MLDDRKLKILYAIIDSYINTSEPIGSRTISKQYNMGISSATIRNEMSDLEELGFLNKAYSSSGRIPSEKAYRHYVNYLLSSHFDKLSNEQFDFDILYKHFNEKRKIFKESAKIISEMTDYITAAMITDYIDCILKGMDIIEINEGLYILVLIFDTGKVINTVFETKESLDNDLIKDLIYCLKKYLIGISLSNLKDKLEYLKLTFVNKLPLISYITELINEALLKTEKVDIKLEGISNIFNFPEYQDINKAKRFVDFLENKEELEDILLGCDSSQLCVKIGSENHKDFFNENTIIATSYDLENGLKAKIAVIGPTRMDYEKILKTMLGLNYKINDILK